MSNYYRGIKPKTYAEILEILKVAKFESYRSLHSTEHFDAGAELAVELISTLEPLRRLMKLALASSDEEIRQAAKRLDSTLGIDDGEL